MVDMLVYLFSFTGISFVLYLFYVFLGLVVVVVDGNLLLFMLKD